MTFVPNISFFEQLQASSDIALAQAADAVKGNLILSQTIPFDTGALQDTLTFVSPVREGKVRIISQGPYARRLYFHPEYNFQTAKNPFAGARWLDPYLAGHEKADEFRSNYAKFLRKRMGGAL